MSPTRAPMSTDDALSVVTGIAAWGRSQQVRLCERVGDADGDLRPRGEPDRECEHPREQGGMQRVWPRARRAGRVLPQERYRQEAHRGGEDEHDRDLD